MTQEQQVSLVGLSPVDPDFYNDTHPITYNNTDITFKRDKLYCYLLVSQLLMLLFIPIENILDNVPKDIIYGYYQDL